MDLKDVSALASVADLVMVKEGRRYTDVPDFALMMSEADTRGQRRAIARQIAGWLGFDHQNRPGLVMEIMDRLDPKHGRSAWTLWDTVLGVILADLELNLRKHEVLKFLCPEAVPKKKEEE